MSSPSPQLPLDAVGEPRPEPGPVRIRRGLLRFVPRPLRRLGRVLIVALIIEYLVVPQIAGTRDALHTLLRVNGAWLALGVALEAVSLAAYAQLLRTVLPQENDPGFWRVQRIQLSTLALSHVVPGGSAAGSALGYRLLTAAGVRRADVGFGLATQGLGSAVILNVILWMALVVSIPIWGLSAVYLAAAAVGLVLVGAFIGLVLLFTRGQRLADRIIRRITRHLPLVDEETVHDLFVRLQVRMRTLGRQRGLLVRAVLLAMANWLFDAASLWVFVGAFGHWANIDGLLVAYGLANVLAAIPITPGGLGVVEATLTSALVGFDTARAVAILGVVAYRLVNFWLPIPVGGLAYLSLHVDSSRADERRPAPQAPGLTGS
ncbi:MAG TPA: YbhN family protein [Acidimicrobiales bacterium]|nr:YbhN family protein [Acidimicrobiales bacterium]